jgi:methionyl aminopeptidase
VDLTLYFQGYHGDTSRTFLLPEVDEQGRTLVEVTREALELGIKACGPGMPLNGIGRVIE